MACKTPKKKKAAKGAVVKRGSGTPRSGKKSNLGKRDGTGRLAGTRLCPKTKKK